MSYFKNFPYVNYKFGNETFDTAIQDLSAYSDIIDLIGDDVSFYEQLQILENDRPDTLSNELYNDVKHYWTFFLLNPKIRESGWPLTASELTDLIFDNHPNTVITTQDDLSGIFKIGSVVTGSTSGETGTIIRRNLDLGQIVIEGTKVFSSTEVITTTEDNVLNSIQLTGESEEVLAIHHYEDSDGYVDIDPHAAPNSSYVAKTYTDHYMDENNSLREIKVLKPSSVSSVFAEFQKVMKAK